MVNGAFQRARGHAFTPSRLILAQPHRITVAVRADASVIFIQAKKTSDCGVSNCRRDCNIAAVAASRRPGKIVRILLDQPLLRLDNPGLLGTKGSQTYEGRCNGKTAGPIR